MSNTVFYNVKNRSAGIAVYKIPELGVRRTFQSGEVKKISAEELEKLTYRPGGMALLANFLQIMEPEAIAKVGLRTEPEYHMSEQDIARLITSGSLDAFLDCLDFAPISVIDLIKKLAIDIPMVDMQKRKALKEKTGFDVEAALKHNEEDKEETQTTILKTNNGERRVQPDAAPAGRRTAPPVTPKYNIIKTADPAAVGDKTAE
jgi:hypothetical protein